MNQLDFGDGLVKIPLVLYANKMSTIPISTTLLPQRESLNKNQNSEIVKL